MLQRRTRRETREELCCPLLILIVWLRPFYAKLGNCLASDGVKSHDERLKVTPARIIPIIMAPKRTHDATRNDAGGKKKQRPGTDDVAVDASRASGVQVGIANAISLVSKSLLLSTTSNELWAVTSNSTVSQKVTPTLLGVTPEVRENIVSISSSN